ncbi:hypothetical protein [Corynebacterium provencense]|nr:hypothetical protein [Corynebacterium provencense]
MEKPVEYSRAGEEETPVDSETFVVGGVQCPSGDDDHDIAGEGDDHGRR